MPRALIPSTVAKREGTKLPAETNGDPVNNHYVVNTGKTKLEVRNAGAAPRTLTIRLYRTVDGQTVTSKVRAIPAGETWVFGPYPKDDYGTQLLVDVDHAELKIRAIE